MIGRRGRPKGLPKPPGSGRKPGTPNRITREVREAAQKHTVKALTTLARLTKHEDPKIALAAAVELLNRGHGKPMDMVAAPPT